mgnify:CR=1 FL=1
MQEIEGKIKKVGGVWYKRSKIKNAFSWKFGEWAASGRLNSDIFKVQRPRIIKDIPSGGYKKTWGMSDAMTYCEAVQMQAALDAGTTTISREAREYGKDYKMFERALVILYTTGAAGFHRYGTEALKVAQ